MNKAKVSRSDQRSNFVFTRCCLVRFNDAWLFSEYLCAENRGHCFNGAFLCLFDAYLIAQSDNQIQTHDANFFHFTRPIRASRTSGHSHSTQLDIKDYATLSLSLFFGVVNVSGMSPHLTVRHRNGQILQRSNSRIKYPPAI